MALALVSMTAASAQQPAPGADRARGVVLDGLRRGPPDGPCGTLLEIADKGEFLGCTPGPDPAPPGVDVREPRSAAGLAGTGTSTAGGAPRICHGDGQSGYRVELLYARASDVADRYGEFVNGFRQWAAQMDDIFNQSAARTGGTRHIRFVHDVGCTPTISTVVVPPEADDNFYQTIQALKAQGYSRTDRKYLVWMDAVVYCGIAEMINEDHPSADNGNNGSGRYPGMVARIDSGCWGQSQLIEAHELTHVLGGVQASAPHGTVNAHCTDEYDRMCYSDGPGVVTTVECPVYFPDESLLDCNNDDYFSTNPPAGSYLADHWNVANSRFLTALGTTTVTPSSAEPGQAVSVSAAGASEPGSQYRARLSTTSVGCPWSMVLGGSVVADASGSVGPVSRTIPTNVTSGTRYICFVNSADNSDHTAPTPISIF